MNHKLARELMQSDAYDNPVVESRTEDCDALYKAFVAAACEGQFRTAAAVFKTALGVGFEVGRKAASAKSCFSSQKEKENV